MEQKEHLTITTVGAANNTLPGKYLRREYLPRVLYCLSVDKTSELMRHLALSSY